MADILSRDALIREISKKTLLNLGDSRAVLDALTEILEEAVSNGVHHGHRFSVSGFGKIIFQKLKKRESVKVNPQGGSERTILPPAYRVTFRLSKKIRGLAKGKIPADND